jgi:hypothetical protein
VTLRTVTLRTVTMRTLTLRTLTLRRARPRAVAPRTPAVRATAGLVAALAITACTPGQVGAAAIVGEERIGVDELQRITEAVAASPVAQGAEPGELQRAVLRELILAEVVEAVGAEHGVTVTQAQVDALLEADPTLQQLPADFRTTIARSGALATAVVTELVPGSADDPGLQDQRQQAFGQALAEQSAELGVEVNPRYGRWEPRALQIDPLPSGGLAEPVGEPAEGELPPDPGQG